LAGRLESIPGVTAAGGISRLPATGSYHPWNTYIRTGPLAGTLIDRSRFAMQQRIISGDLLAALGIPVLAGRSFDARDEASAPARAVVSANFVRAAFPGVSPEAALETVGLGAIGGLDAGYLSAGQTKRLALARLLVTDRKLWLLDEPLAALDAAGDTLVARLIADRLASGGAVIAATHDELPGATQTLTLGSAA